MKKIANKVISFFKSNWKKIVNGIIITGIIYLVTSFLAIIFDYSFKQITNLLIEGLRLEIPIYLVFIIIVIIIFLFFFIKNKVNSIWNEKIGDYTFKELHKVLREQNFPVRTRAMEWSGQKAPKDNLLSLYCFFKPYLNMGVTLDLKIGDGGYLYGVFCPKMVSYGIIEQIVIKNLEKGHETIEFYKYQVTPIGHKFYNLLEKTKFVSNKKGADPTI